LTVSPLRVLFHAAAGPRLGFGHLVRCRSLARALGVDARVSIRGSAATRAAAALAGWQVLASDDDRELRKTDPQLLIIDDPSQQAAGIWVRRARRLGLRVATVHDLGVGYVASDLGIDGSIEPGVDMRGSYGDLRGPAHAILDPDVTALREHHVEATPNQILIALGGGSHGVMFAERLCRAIAAEVPEAQIRVAIGFSGGRCRRPLAHGEWIHALDGLAAELAAASVAVVAGGVTLYEACALGVPAVAVAVTPAQTPTICAFAAHGAAIDGGVSGTGRCTVEAVAAEVAGLLRRRVSRRRLTAAGQRLVDGRGAFRVGAALRQLCAFTPSGVTHAA
jgi:spore coat polysaccharide biosynthesis predicted glycosyltransferase SpsG